MKTRTRVVAWFYILLQLPAMLVVTVLMVAGGSMVALPHFMRSPGIETLFNGKVAGPVLILVAVIEGLILFLHVLPWICLLRKKAWAWWMLTVLYCAGMAFWLTGTLFLASQEQPTRIKPAFMTMLPFLIVFGPTLLFLLTDRPSIWRKRRTGSTRRRRKRRATYRTRRS